MKQGNRVFIKGKLNNKGVTLVELLVSITMLSIVVGAFYSCFVLAAKTNAKAKLAHKATSLAQNILENIKAEDMDSLMGQIQWPRVTTSEEDGTLKTVQNFRLVSQAGYDISNVVNLSGNALATSTNGGMDAVYNSDLDEYQFVLRNVKMENSLFDALVTVKPSDAVNEEGTSIANREMVHIPSMDSNYDAVISNGAVYDREAVSYFESKGVYDALAPSDITRTITVDIEEDVKIGGSVEYQVNATYRYDCQDELYEVTDMVFSNESDTTKVLRNVFVFFNPHFEWIDAGWTENIVVNNADDYVTDLYLIKQQPAVDEAALVQETSKDYKVRVLINEGNADGQEASSVDIKTNLGYSFTAPTVPIAARCQAEYCFNGVQRTTDYKEFFDITALTNMSVAELLFDVNIKIYAGDETRSIAVASDYDGENLLTELNGTLRN